MRGLVAVFCISRVFSRGLCLRADFERYLDYETGKQVLTLLQNASHVDNKTVIVITHNSELAKMADRVIRIHDAKVQSIVDNPNPTPVKDIEW